MRYELTPGAQRALSCAAGWTGSEGRLELEAPALLMGLLAESECLGALVLARHGIDAEAVQRRWPELLNRTPSMADGPAARFSAEVDSSLRAVCERFARYESPLILATEHMLLALAVAGNEVSQWLCRQGLDADELEAEIHQLYGHPPGTAAVEGPLPLGAEEPPPISSPCPPVDPPIESRPDATLRPAATRVLRVIDAAANRAREGLRVVEDYVRFVLDDAHLTRLCKQLRHDLHATLQQVSIEHRMAARETLDDVGTRLATKSERRREDAAGVATANLSRLQEALRSLEEFGKLLDADMAARLEQLRYRTYTLERALQITRTSLQRLEAASLYVLIDGRESTEQFERLALSMIEAGVHLIQLRDKRLDDRRLLKRARLLRQLTRERETLFIMNDRPDLAALARADGVHVGQEELSLKDARSIVGPEALVGVSTHSIEQARQAVLDGANYLGVGPTFPSGTKQFEHFPGVGLLKTVAAEIRLPAFAIGGITAENLDEVLAAGFRRIAVGGAITAAADPAAAARELLAALNG